MCGWVHREFKAPLGYMRPGFKTKQKYIYITKWCSALKRNKFLTCTMLWLDLKGIVLCEVGQTPRGNDSTKYVETENRRE